MKPIDVLVMMPCGGCKLDRPASLLDLYTGPLWQTLRTHRGGVPRDNVTVLSARYGFASALESGEPYDERMSEQKADYLIAGGVCCRRDDFGRITNGATGAQPLAVLGFRPRPFAAVIIAGAGHYRRVLNAFVIGFKDYGAVERDALILTVAGGIGEQRAQLGRWLDQANAGTLGGGS
jgi:hypothetical protein